MAEASTDGGPPERRDDERPASRPGPARSRATDRPSAATEHGAFDDDDEEVWILEEVRSEATDAVGRAAKPSAKRGARRSAPPPVPAPRPGDLGTSDDLAGELTKQVGERRAVRLEDRLRSAGRAFSRERYPEARTDLRKLSREVPGSASVRELLGLTYYRLGQWKEAVRELEAFRTLSGSTEQHPVLADCYRALGRHREVEALWEDLREQSPSAELVAEGRIVMAGSLADRDRLSEAVGVLATAKWRAKRPREHHLRMAYALADLHERSGDLPKARELFGWVAQHDREFADVSERLRALG